MRILKKTIPAMMLVAAAIFASSGAASAQGDLYYMHNGSAYYVWSDYEVCKSDLRSSGNDCSPAFDFETCGRYVVSTIATRNVAADKLRRGDEVLLRHTSGNSGFCRVTK